MQTLDAPHPNQRDVLPGRVLASRGTGPGMRLGWSGMTLAIDGRADVQKGRDVLRGGGPVACVMPVVTEFVTLLADFVPHSIGDLAGATVVTLLAATATQFARPENPRQSFPSLMKASPAELLLARVEIG